ncbi:uncharacterized protein UHOD_11054 [Ustilago sp. UG-2017b]|nr:uncharacterized protein UHOD_11054 [Ustilago sp. UG-2017b]
MRGGRERAQRNLYVLNLPLDATTDHFEALFAQYGSVEHTVILATLDHLARRRGFILMADTVQARAAIDSLNGYVWHHYRIEVSFAIVQRSGTPFSQDVADDASRQEKPSQLTQTSTSIQPLEHMPASDTSVRLDQKVPRGLPDQSSDDATLYLSVLDTSVITSLAMVRALTEPFGHVVELHSPEQAPGTSVHSQAKRDASSSCPPSAQTNVVSDRNNVEQGCYPRLRQQSEVAGSFTGPDPWYNTGLSSDMTSKYISEDLMLSQRQCLGLEVRKRVAKAQLRTDRDQKEHEIQEALSAFQKGQFKDLKAAAEHHNVPYNTLWDRSKGCKSCTAAFQHLQAIPPEAEELLVQHIQKQAHYGFLVTPQNLRQLAEQLLRQRTNNNDATLGPNWVSAFKQRHPELRSYYSCKMDAARVQATSDPSVVEAYFDVLEKTIAKYRILPENIFNIDKTGFLIGQSQCRYIIVPRENGKNQCFRSQPGNWETITVIECIGAQRTKPPPMVIVWGKNHMQGVRGRMPET